MADGLLGGAVSAPIAEVLSPTVAAGGDGGTASTTAADIATLVANGLSAKDAAKYLKKHKGDVAAAYDDWYAHGGSGSGSTGDGGSSSSSGGSAAVGPSPQDLANAMISYFNLLTGYGIAISPAMRTLVEGAVKDGLNSAAFMLALRNTKDYAEAFPGIMRADGTMRMTEAQYMAGFSSARDYASTVGRSLNKQAYGLAIKNGNSPSEIRAKIEALDILRTNSDVFGQFSDYLVTRGVINKPLTKADLLAFVMKQGPKAWEQEWQTAYAASQIEATGISIGRGEDIGYKGLQGLIKHAGPGIDITKVDYAQLAQMVQTALPASALYQAGITKKALVALAFGGPKAVPIAQRVQDVLATYKARFEAPVEPQLTGGGLYTGAPQNVQTTE